MTRPVSVSVPVPARAQKELRCVPPVILNPGMGIPCPRPVSLGGTGDPPVPVGDSPTGTLPSLLLSNDVLQHAGCPGNSAGPVARRHGRVARSTQVLPVLSCAVAALLAALPFVAAAQPDPEVFFAPSARKDRPDPAPAILQELRSFREMGSVLLVAAHPDDEDSSLIAFLARGRYCRTAYLSVTRGDGGQNVLGPEIGDELGVIRTQELLAARRVDGGRQFFTRARDFGYSKDYRETFKFWGEQDVLSDVVRVIRTFRPDVVIAVFSTNSTPGQHGHHTASAILAGEAFKLAGDTNAFPEQLDKLKPWQPARLLQDRGRALTMEVGEEYGTIAGLSRSMHKTQGFGNFSPRGATTAGFTFLAGAPATNDILDGVDTTWGRVPGGKEIGVMADDVISHFDPAKPDASVSTLVRMHHLLAGLPSDPVLDEKRRQLDHIIQECLGLEVETHLLRAEVVPGEELSMANYAAIRSGVPVRWLGVRYPGEAHESGGVINLVRDQTADRYATRILPANTPITQPYWLREEGAIGLFRVDDVSLIGKPENPPVFPIEQVFEVSGEKFIIPDDPAEVFPDLFTLKDTRLAMRVIPPVRLDFVDNLELFPPGTARNVVVNVRAAIQNVTGTLRLEAPPGWRVTPPAQPFSIVYSGDRFNSDSRGDLTFSITAPAQTGTAEILAVANVGGVDWHTRRVKVRYDHIPPQLLQPPARLKALSLDMAVRARKVGYIPGAGDDVAAALARMGCEVTQLTGVDLTPEKLSGLDAVVVGIRAFNVRPDLATNLPRLLDFATNGGNVIVLYNRPAQGRQSVMFSDPYSLSISGDRVTDQTAEMTLLVPEHPVFNTPNKIGPADFDGWVQERGAYFAVQWDPHFTPLIACHDPGEQPLRGSLLVAQCGKGNFVYTALSWFRQLPDGVPGAYRLFANLVSLGK
jgi:LmbE family N-acetylglucosaminyl deacetylase